MKKSILTFLKYSLISLAIVWFMLVNILSFASAFYTPSVVEVYKEVSQEAEYCHAMVGSKSNYPVTRENGVIDSPNRALFGLLPVSHMIFAGEYIDEGYLLYHQYFLIIPIGAFEFPCSTTQWP